MRKCIVTLFLCFFMLCPSNLQALASELNTVAPTTVTLAIAPRMDYIAQAKGSLYIDSSGNATISSSVYGYQGTTTRVTICARLQQYKNSNWITLKTYTAESNSHRASLNEIYTISKGYSYRVQATITAYSGSSSEIRTVTSSEAAY